MAKSYQKKLLVYYKVSYLRLHPGIAYRLLRSIGKLTELKRDPSYRGVIPTHDM